MRALLAITLVMGTAPAFAGQHHLTFNGSEESLSFHPQTVQWTGSIDLTTASEADGTYTGSDLSSFSVQSNLINFATDGNNSQDSMSRLDFGLNSVNLSNGRVASIKVGVIYATHPDTKPTAFSVIFSDMRGQYSANWWPYGDTVIVHADAVEQTQEIQAVDPLPAIPEPSTYWLMLAGLFALAVSSRKESRSDADLFT